MNKIGDLQGKNILLLQGPMGDFFKRFELYLRSKGAITHKIGFNLADWFYSNKKSYIPYRGRPEEWSDYLVSFLRNRNIDNIFLFGDCRFYQRVAVDVARKMGIEVFVFEEGYIRPDYITMEKWGVNAYSSIPREKEFYIKLPKSYLGIRKAAPAHPSFFKMAKEATIYYILAYFGKVFYPHYRHHRELNIYKEAFYGVRNAYRKVKYKITERNLMDTILKTDYFFVPLQTASDFQVREHSDFTSMEEFIEEVLTSFAGHAPKELFLVFKHHPMDRGRYDYTLTIYSIAKKLSVDKRVIVVHDLHLPTLLKHARGCVTINSTVGLQALYHNAPVKVLGRALYDIEELTNSCSLDEFWSAPKKPDRELYVKFRNFLIDNTQVNGSFWGLFPKFDD